MIRLRMNDRLKLSPLEFLKLFCVMGFSLVLLVTAAHGLAGSRTLDENEWKLPPEAKKTKNPIAASADSLTKGKLAYERNCQSCHGPTGDGNTPIGTKLKPKPGDLRSKKEMGEISDGEMFYMISLGKKPMPGYEKKLSKDDRWHVVNYTRTLAK